MAHVLPELSAHETTPLWESEFDLYRSHALPLQGFFTGIGGQKAIVLRHHHEMPQLGATRLHLYHAQAEIGTERSVRQGKMAMLLTQLREVFERRILLREFDMPATNFYGAQLRVLEWLPVHEGRPIHDRIVPAHEFEIILFGMPAQPGDKISRANPGRGRQIP